MTSIRSKQRQRRDLDPVRAPAVVVGERLPSACVRSWATSLPGRRPGRWLMPRQRPGQSDCSVGPIARKVDGEVRVTVVGVDDGVEDQPLDVAAGRRARRRSPARSRRRSRTASASRRPAAGRIASMSCDGVRRRVVPAGDADAGSRSPRRRPCRAGAGPLEPRAAQQPGAPGAALVVADQPEAVLELGQRWRRRSASRSGRRRPGRRTGTSASGRSSCRTRPIRRSIVPGSTPARSSGTVSVAHARRGSPRTTPSCSAALAAFGRASSAARASSAERTAALRAGRRP